MIGSNPGGSVQNLTELGTVRAQSLIRNADDETETARVMPLRGQGTGRDSADCPSSCHQASAMDGGFRIKGSSSGGWQRFFKRQFITLKMLTPTIEIAEGKVRTPPSVSL
jgi:hypothetical protein